MARQNGIMLAYGYIVCLITVITFLFGSYSLFQSIVGRSSVKIPSSKYSSVENYKTDLVNDIKEKYNCDEKKANMTPYIPNDSDIKKMYEKEKESRMARDIRDNTTEIISKFVLVLFSALLFLFHWRLVRGHR